MRASVLWIPARIPSLRALLAASDLSLRANPLLRLGMPFQQQRDRCRRVVQHCVDQESPVRGDVVLPTATESTPPPWMRRERRHSIRVESEFYFTKPTRISGGVSL